MDMEMDMLTNKEVIKELRKPGKVYMPILMKNDVTFIAIEKADLIAVLQYLDPNIPCEWTFYGNYNGGRKLDVQG